jgi:hypothetical protein
MDALIRQLRNLGYTFNPPCTEEQIRALDATIAALYGDHGRSNVSGLRL